jgi:hypothetical protein
MMIAAVTGSRMLLIKGNVRKYGGINCRNRQMQIKRKRKTMGSEQL